MKDIVIKDIKRKTTIPIGVIKKAAVLANETVKQTKTQGKAKPKSKAA